MDRAALLESMQSLYEVSEHQAVSWLFFGYFYSRLYNDDPDGLDSEIVSLGVDSLRRSGKIPLARATIQLIDNILADATTGGMELDSPTLERLNRARFEFTDRTRN